MADLEVTDRTDAALHQLAIAAMMMIRTSPEQAAAHVEILARLMREQSGLGIQRQPKRVFSR